MEIMIALDHSSGRPGMVIPRSIAEKKSNRGNVGRVKRNSTVR